MKKVKWNVLIVALSFGILMGMASFFDWFGYAELFYEDVFYQSEDKINNKIKIIAIDDRTLSALGDYNGWSRENYAKLVNTLCTQENKPAIIAFDVMFMDNREEEGDLAFAEACERAGNVVVATKLSTSVKFDEQTQKINTFYVNECLQPYEALVPFVATGYTNIILDNDGFVRHSLPIAQGGGIQYQSFSTVVYQKYLYSRGAIEVPTPNSPFLIDYSAGPGSYEIISMCDVLDHTVPASVFDDAIVLVGGCSDGLMDSYSVPINRRTLMYGVEINANIIQALLEGKYLFYLDKTMVAFLTTLFSTLFLYLMNDKKVRFMSIGLGVCVTIHIGLCLLLIQSGVILLILYQLCAYLIAYFINLIWKYASERRKRMKELHDLLFSMAEAMTEAIDGRTPYNASHTRKVAKYSVSLAEYINTKHKRKETKLHLKREEIEQLHLAALLHDVGKLDVSTKVLDKPSRLGQYLEPLLTKIETLRLLIQLDAATGRIDVQTKEQKIAELIELSAFIEMVNTKEWLTDNQKKYIASIKESSYPNEEGELISYLTDTEYECLMIGKGTLTSEEIEKVREHVVYTDRILSKISFGRHYGKVQSIAASHHELLNGKGYPNHLQKEDIGISVRILTIADVYDALTADDRPYKRAKTKEESFKILHFMEKDGEIDGEILKFAEELWSQNT